MRTWRNLTPVLAALLAILVVGQATAAVPTLRSPGVRKAVKRVPTKPATAPAPTELSATGSIPT